MSGSPTVKHWGVLEQIRCYLEESPSLAFVSYKHHGHTSIECFTNADRTDSRLIQDPHHVTTLFLSVGVWHLGEVRTRTLSRSSEELKYRAMTQSTFEILRIYQLLTEV